MSSWDYVVSEFRENSCCTRYQMRRSLMSFRGWRDVVSMIEHAFHHFYCVYHCCCLCCCCASLDVCVNYVNSEGMMMMLKLLRRCLMCQIICLTRPMTILYDCCCCCYLMMMLRSSLCSASSWADTYNRDIPLNGVSVDAQLLQYTVASPLPSMPSILHPNSSRSQHYAYRVSPRISYGARFVTKPKCAREKIIFYIIY